MDWLVIPGYVIFFVYAVSLLYVTLFCLMQLHLLYRYFFGKWDYLPPHTENKISETELPFVTIQLPVFNEKYVVERLIDNIVLLDYPKDKFEIHVLDDSTDDTIEISRRKVEEYQSKGYHISLLHRTDRSGFKAGALKEGMKKAKGEFIAIFDADFLPKPDFLRQTLPSFSDTSIGVVQTRWEHINQHYSLLTELQAFQLNVHFTVEQLGRYKAGYMLQFNGTAGIWRKSCITDAGGWEADTLTEDLDLSYRAQMKGWKIKYMEEVTAPSELPSEINGLKSQQFRWMKGGAETARKLLPKVWSSGITLNNKIQATIHLLSSSIFIFVFIMSILSFPLMFFIDPLALDASKLSLFFVSLLAIILVYYVANVEVAWPKENKIKMTLKFILLFPVFLSLSMALAFHNSHAVMQGFLGLKSKFVRTPKYGVSKKNDEVNKTSYFSKKISKIAMGEAVLSIYFFIAIYAGLKYDMKEFFILHILLAFGYLTLYIYAVRSKFSK
jgi:cellulose synthase/poly-beta-1,6-N-acetylglucosamine synthase-like glycosyltransferase